MSAVRSVALPRVGRRSGAGIGVRSSSVSRGHGIISPPISWCRLASEKSPSSSRLAQIPSWSDPCEPDPCENEATCHSMEQDFYCACPEGYEGKTCEQLRERCESAPCQGDPGPPMGWTAPPRPRLPQDLLKSHLIVPQRSTAALLPWRPTTRPECGTSPPTSAARGDAASARPAPTSPVCATPASAASTATKVRSLSAPPSSPAPRRGLRRFWAQWQIDVIRPGLFADVNDCISDPCSNGGTCVDGVNAFQCVCPGGWEGRLCDLGEFLLFIVLASVRPPCLTSAPLSFSRSSDVNECKRQPCKNGGRCHDLVNDFYCECVDNWKGKTCHSREWRRRR